MIILGRKRTAHAAGQAHRATADKWLLSDHTAARVERAACRAATYRDLTESAAAVHTLAVKVNATPDALRKRRDLAAMLGPAKLSTAILAT